MRPFSRKMHPEARDFVAFVKGILPEAFVGKRVLDVGSGDINGNNRWLFENCEYEGNDVYAGRNVTIVSKTKDLVLPSGSLDTIVSTECFEHDPEYADSWRKIYDLLKPGGVFCFTCASTGRKEHGTRKSSPGDSFGTIGKLADMQDYYKNLDVNDLHEVFPLDDAFSAWDAYYQSNTCDLYFVGVKRDPAATGAGVALPKYYAAHTTSVGSAGSAADAGSAAKAGCAAKA